jgi:demethylmenaquinone methyltransferase/2-methoxy-6-polyprenyl-1,4-benzoquinol methylase
MHQGELERPRTPQAMFHRVAPYYDTVNFILSLGFDRRWRRQTAQALHLSPGARVLDVATGTGALAMELHRATAGSAFITACDVNDSMLAVAQKRSATGNAHIAFVKCDATALPFADASFDAITIAFAIDDMPDREQCAREMWRVLRPGGELALLELGQPEGPLLNRLYRSYLKLFRLLRHGQLEGYGHLEQEIVLYRGAHAVERLLTSTGFAGYRQRSLTFGIARLHLAQKDDVSRPKVDARVS